MKNKKLIALVCTVLLLVGAAGATLAWLMDQSGPVTNTFTASDLGVELTETERTYPMVPGYSLEKDPKVSVNENSEACWIFVKVDESQEKITYSVTDEEGNIVQVEKTFDDFIEYHIDAGWTPGDGGIAAVAGEPANNVPVGVYFREVSAETAKAGVIYNVLTSNETYKNGFVKVKDTVTKEMMDAVTQDNMPKLTFQAFAHQLYKNENAVKFTPEEAWVNLNL